MRLSAMGRILTVGSIVIALSACGGNKSQSTTTTTTTTTAVTAAPMTEGSPASQAAQPAAGVSAQPIPANLSCAAGDIVWANLSKKSYHESSDMYFGRTKHGQYMCRQDAIAKGFHAAGQRSHRAHHGANTMMAPATPEATP